jgi:hypothetical protein
MKSTISNTSGTSLAKNAVAASVRSYGFRQPIVADIHDVIIIGHIRLTAAKKLGRTSMSGSCCSPVGPGGRSNLPVLRGNRSG